MALTPQNNDAFMREVDEELRRDEMMNFWRRWGRWVVVGVIAAMLAFGGYLFWQHRQTVAAGEQGEALANLFDAIAANETATVNSTAAELATSDIPGIRASALMADADRIAQGGDLKAAATRFAAIAGDAELPQPFREMALIRQTALEFDTLPPQQVVSRLQGLAGKDSPFLGSAGELVGTAYLRMERYDLAGQVFREIAGTETVPETIRQRAVQMTAVLGAQTPAAKGAPRTPATAGEVEEAKTK